MGIRLQIRRNSLNDNKTLLKTEKVVSSITTVEFSFLFVVIVA